MQRGFVLAAALAVAVAGCKKDSKAPAESKESPPPSKPDQPVRAPVDAAVAAPTVRHPLSKRLLSLNEETFHHGPPRPAEEMEELERAVGERFPVDYRAVLLEVGPCAIAGPKMKLVIDLVEDVLLSIKEDSLNERMPGIVMFGNDGGDYGFYYDPKGRLGHGEFAVYLVEMGTLTFAESRFVAPSLGEAIAKLLAGENFRDLPMIGK